jgi:hypothetical protein
MSSANLQLRQMHARAVCIRPVLHSPAVRRPAGHDRHRVVLIAANRRLVSFELKTCSNHVWGGGPEKGVSGMWRNPGVSTALERVAPGPLAHRCCTRSYHDVLHSSPRHCVMKPLP